MTAGKKYGFLDDEYYRRLGQHDIKVVPAMRDVSLTLVRGEAALAFYTASAVTNSLIAEGAPLKPLVMEEGNTIHSAPISLVKNAPHPNAAKVLINWLLTSEGQIAANKARGALPLRQELPDFAPEKGRFEIKKPLFLGIQDQMEVSRLARELVVDRLLGLEKK